MPGARKSILPCRVIIWSKHERIGVVIPSGAQSRNPVTSTADGMFESPASFIEFRYGDFARHDNLI